MSIYSEIFNPGFNFEKVAIEIFRLQAKQNKVYSDYLAHIKLSPQSVLRLEDIPFLPVRFFKSHKVVTGKSKTEIEFTSSGTTGTATSSHHVSNIKLYEQSFMTAFKQFYGPVTDYCFIALLPSYLERTGSSLVYMCQKLIAESHHPCSGFYLNEYKKLSVVLTELESKKQKTILIGVTYALLDLAEQFPMPLQNTILMETGGMKGKRPEMIKSEMHAVLCKAFLTNKIHSEYGMTELLSQAYSHGNGLYKCPPWMKVFTRDTNDPLAAHVGSGNGGLNIIDLANIGSCSFIATQDLGKVYSDGSFEVLGRFDDAEIRGCNLMVE